MKAKKVRAAAPLFLAKVEYISKCLFPVKGFFWFRSHLHVLVLSILFIAVGWAPSMAFGSSVYNYMALTNSSSSSPLTTSVVSNAFLVAPTSAGIGTGGIGNMWVTNNLGGFQGPVNVNGKTYYPTNGQFIGQIVNRAYTTFDITFPNSGKGVTVGEAFMPPPPLPAYSGLLDQMGLYNDLGNYAYFQINSTGLTNQLNVESSPNNVTTHSGYFTYPQNTLLWISLTFNTGNGTETLNVYNATNWVLLFSTTSSAMQSSDPPVLLRMGQNETDASATGPDYFGSVLISTNMLNSIGVTNIVAKSPSLIDVSNAIAAADPGDTVTIPSGSATWTSALTVTNMISIVGSGNPVIYDGEPRPGNANMLILAPPTNTVLQTLSGITFAGTNGTTEATAGAVVIQSGFWHVTNCTFTNLNNYQLLWNNANTTLGSIDHCSFYAPSVVSELEVWGNGYGDTSWAKPVPYGTTNMLVVENNVFSYNSYPQPAVDCNHGAEVTFRNNFVTNVFFQTHGTESSQRWRGARALEIYGNTFVQNAVVNQGVAVHLRSGTGVIFSNIITGYADMVQPVDNRSIAQYPPFGSANGQDTWDSNNPSLLASGTATAQTSNQLIDSTKNWSINQWVGGYTLQDKTQGGTNTSTFSLIYSNNATTLFVIQPLNSSAMVVTNGDSYAIYQSYAHLDQVGRGSGDLVADTAPSSGVPSNTVTHALFSWPHEALEPLYIWGNTLNGAANYGEPQGSFNIILNGRDYINGTIKPGYTPLTYPYPWSGSPSLSPKYTLTVLNGTGSGSYTSNSVVAISAVAPAGEVFSSWSGLHIAATNSPTTSVLMPGANLTVTADFVPMPPTGLRVVSASGQ